MVSNSPIHVAVAVIVNLQEQVLIARRASHQHQGNKWEFPGGKVEDGETSEEALVREIKEELGIVVKSSKLMTDILYSYKNSDGTIDKNVLLDIYLVDEFFGEPAGKERQPIQWVDKKDLGNYEFPEANAEIISRLLEDC